MPLVYASLLSAVIVGTGYQLPRIAEDAISLAGQLAIPLMLLSLGAAMARLDVPATALCCGLAAFRLCFGAVVGCAVAWVSADRRHARRVRPAGVDARCD